MKYLLPFLPLFVFISTAIGVYYIVSAFAAQPQSSVIKAVKARAPHKVYTQEVIIQKLAGIIVRFINIDPYKRDKLAKDLRSLNITHTPELFKARCLAMGIMYSVVVIPFAFIMPVLLFAIPLIIYAVFSKEQSKVTKLVEKRTKEIEKDLAQFASTIRQHLNNTRDIVAIFESYRKIARGALKDEIDITINDMKSGNIERALKSLSGRVNSSKLSELVRGLIGVSRGDDQRNYFEMIAYDFQKAANEELRREILARPAKLKINQYLMLGAILAMFLTAIIPSAAESLALLL